MIVLDTVGMTGYNKRMMMTAIDICYLHDLLFWARRNALAIVKRCPECDEIMPEGYLDLLRWSEQHGVIDTREQGATECRPTLVIGCEGYHIMNEFGGEKNHEID